MFRWLFRLLACLTVALAPFGALAGVAGTNFFLFGHWSPAQTAQFGGANCYYGDGWNGRGWYRCGDQWNDSFGWVGPFNQTIFPAMRRHGRNDRHGVAISPPRAPNPVYLGSERSRGVGVGGGTNTNSL